MDLVEFPDQGNTKILANMLCWGTGFQMACLMPNKTSVSARDALANAWIKHYGWMELLVTDQGPEFVGREFSTYVAENDAFSTSLTLRALGNKAEQNARVVALRRIFAMCLTNVRLSLTRSSTLP